MIGLCSRKTEGLEVYYIAAKVSDNESLANYYSTVNKTYSDIVLSYSSCIEAMKILCGQIINIWCTTYSTGTKSFKFDYKI